MSTPHSMRALVVHASGGLFEEVQLPRPKPGEGEVLVRIHASGVNPLDTKIRGGDEVYGLTGGVAGLQGSLAEYAAVDADLLASKPAALSMREAAALPLVVITAWKGLVDRAQTRAGQKVLVHGGAGGVGHGRASGKVVIDIRT